MSTNRRYTLAVWEVVMMKFKNTLIIFLGIIAIIFAGCKEKKATHESGTLEEPKVETYVENGVNFIRKKNI